MLKLSNVSSLVMVKISLDIAFMIQLISNSLEVVMLCSFEYQTIEDIDKTEKLDSHTDESLVDVDPIPIIDTSSAHEGTQGNDQDNGDSVEHIIVPTNDVVVDNQSTHVGMTASDAPEISCRRSTREKRSSTHYSHDEYILLTNMREPEGYD